MDELPKVVWSHHTFVSRAMKFTPFRLIYRAKVAVLEEIQNKTLRALELEASSSNEVDKDLLENGEIRQQSKEKFQCGILS